MAFVKKFLALALVALLALLVGCAGKEKEDQTSTPLSEFPKEAGNAGNRSITEENFGSLPALDANFTLHVLYFYGATCRYSARSTPNVQELKLNYSRNVELHMYEIWENAENRKVFDEVADAYGIPAEKRAVPTAFIDGEYLIGYQKINDYLKNEIDVCLRVKCPNPLDAPKNKSIAKPI